MSSLLGRRIQRSDGVLGVIVNATGDTMWRRGQACLYDIVWEDKSFARKVMPETISASGWLLQQERVDPAECSRIWSEFQVERSRQLGARYASGGPGASNTPRPIVVNRAIRLGHRPSITPATEPASASAARPASWHARRLLAAAMPGIEFAISIDHRKLTVGWLDGPVESRVNQVVRGLHDTGSIEKVVLRRGAQSQFVQAAIEHVVARVWGELDRPGAQSTLMRLTPEDYQSRLLATVMTPMECPIGMVPYSTLIRCVIDRWDDEQSAFVEADRTRYLTEERAFLFPAGDALESRDFGDRLRALRDRANDARQFTNEFSHADRARG